jgi:lipopolysaccharide transport system ATP-binding protein
MDAIVIRDLSKSFRKYAARREYTSLKSELVRWVLRRPQPLSATQLTALRSVNLTVKKGQTFGLVGRNGSGKSTLLKLVTGIYKPTVGSIEVHGRISALLELGAGFHPDFSGRENILINGIILGMSRREIRARMDEIIEFSELGDFVDEPVRFYSSGMYARLAFSVATHVDPEILIIDEILSVGDAHFAHKSAAKMEEFRRNGKTILLVTHDLGTLERNCDAAAWLDGGEVRACGDPQDVVAQYRQAIAEGEARGRALPAGAPAAIPLRQPTTGPAAEPGRRWGTFEMEISRVEIVGATAESQKIFSPESPLTLQIAYKSADTVDAPEIEVSIEREDGLAVFASSTSGSEDPVVLAPSGTIVLAIPRIGLGEGAFRIDVAAYAAGRRLCDFQRGAQAFTVKDTASGGGLVRPVHAWSTPDRIEAVAGSADRVRRS